MKDNRVNQGDFREALSRTAATVSVVTTDGDCGRHRHIAEHRPGPAASDGTAAGAGGD